MSVCGTMRTPYSKKYGLEDMFAMIPYTTVVVALKMKTFKIRLVLPTIPGVNNVQERGHPTSYTYPLGPKPRHG